MYLLTNIFPVKDLQKIVQEDLGIVKSQIVYNNKSNMITINNKYTENELLKIALEPSKGILLLLNYSIIKYPNRLLKVHP